jgi:small subunit ribosomal protein S1
MESNPPVIGDNGEPIFAAEPTTPPVEPNATAGTPETAPAAHEAHQELHQEPAPAESAVVEQQPELVAEELVAEVQPTEPAHSEPDVHDEQPANEVEPQAEPEAIATARFIDESPSAEQTAGVEPGVKKGEILEGTIISTSPTSIEIDLGEERTGVVQSRELDRMDRATLDALHEGEKVLVSVVNPKGEGDRIILSITRAAEEKDWRDAETMRQQKALYVGKIDGFNKGGLIVRFGRLRGFVPESQVSRERRERADASTSQDKWAGMRGESIAVVVLEVERDRNRLILSEREAVPQFRERQKSQLLDQIQVGDVRVGHIKSLSDFGAFVDIGGADGLVHLTEISWKHITHPQDVLKIGQEVKVEVINIDRERKRIGLSIRRQEEDPWATVTTRYAINDLVQGTITKLAKFGAFARLVDDPEIEGLIHITELSEGHVEHPRDVVKEGDVLTLRVVKIDPEQRRIGLSLRRANDPGFVERDYARATGAPPPIEDPADINSMSYKDDGRRRRRTTGAGTGGGEKGGGGNKGGGKGGGRRGGGHFDEESEF